MIINDDTKIYIDYYNCLLKNGQISQYYKKYLNHILNHKNMVYIAWIYIADTLHELSFIDKEDICHINKLIINHDDSKYEIDEFIPYAKKFNKPFKNQKIQTDFKLAVKLHKERNLHHYETLKSYNGNNWKHYAIELICDYIAMGWEFNNYICEYFEKIKDNFKNNLPKEYYNYIESIIKIIPEKLKLVEEPLTKKNIEYIYYVYNNYNDPFEENNLKINKILK